jgi:hypothetical protein
MAMNSILEALMIGRDAAEDELNTMLNDNFTTKLKPHRIDAQRADIAKIDLAIQQYKLNIELSNAERRRLVQYQAGLEAIVKRGTDVIVGPDGSEYGTHVSDEADIARQVLLGMPIPESSTTKELPDD